MTDMVTTFVENIRTLTTQCRQLEKQHHEQLTEIAVRAHETATRPELDKDLNDELQEVWWLCGGAF